MDIFTLSFSPRCHQDAILIQIEERDFKETPRKNKFNHFEISDNNLTSFSQSEFLL